MGVGVAVRRSMTRATTTASSATYHKWYVRTPIPVYGGHVCDAECVRCVQVIAKQQARFPHMTWHVQDVMHMTYPGTTQHTYTNNHTLSPRAAAECWCTLVYVSICVWQTGRSVWCWTSL